MLPVFKLKLWSLRHANAAIYGYVGELYWWQYCGEGLMDVKAIKSFSFAQSLRLDQKGERVTDPVDYADYCCYHCLPSLEIMECN